MRVPSPDSASVGSESGLDLGRFACPNRDCPDHGLAEKGNIALRGRYGRDRRPLLYCRTCGQRFAATTGTPLFGAHLPVKTIHGIIHLAAEGRGVRETARMLDLDKNVVSSAIARVGAHVAKVLGDLLASLSMTEDQLDQLLAFLKSEHVAKRLKKSPGDPDSEGPAPHEPASS